MNGEGRQRNQEAEYLPADDGNCRQGVPQRRQGALLPMISEGGASPLDIVHQRYQILHVPCRPDVDRKRSIAFPKTGSLLAIVFRDRRKRRRKRRREAICSAPPPFERQIEWFQSGNGSLLKRSTGGGPVWTVG